MISPDLIQAIHKSSSPMKLVIAMAGNGTQAISELMRYGNGSATLLAQHLLYDSAAFDRYIGGRPDKYVNAQASRQLAMAAYMESRTIANEAYPTAGIGCTSALVKPDGEREGREHLIFVSVQNQSRTSTLSISLDARLKRSRVEEEWINALAILNAVATIRGLRGCLDDLLAELLQPSDMVQTQDTGEVDPALSDVLHARRNWYLPGTVTLDSPCVVCAGSFNPLHPAHLKLLQLGENKTGLPGIFELSITNVDKPPLDFLEIQQRMRQFEQHRLPVIITNRPRYLGKVELFPEGSAFVMGSDTFLRLVDARYYDKSETPLDTFEARGTRFIVAARPRSDGTAVRGEDILLQIKDSALSNRWSRITTCIPADQFLMNISSSEIRLGSDAANKHPDTEASVTPR